MNSTPATAARLESLWAGVHTLATLLEAAEPIRDVEALGKVWDAVRELRHAVGVFADAETRAVLRAFRNAWREEMHIAEASWIGK